MDAVVAFIAKGPPRGTNTMPVSAARSETALRKQRLETRPQRIVQERLCHARPYQVDRASTRDQSDRGFEILSNFDCFPFGFANSALASSPAASGTSI